MKGCDSMKNVKRADGAYVESGGIRVQPSRFERVIHKIWQDKLIYLMILPVVVYYVVFRYLPMLWLGISFYDYKILLGIQGSQFVGLANFQYFFSNPDFLRILWNTIYLSVLCLVFCFPAPILFALLLNEVSGRYYKKAVQTISYLPYFLSSVVVVGIVYSLLSPTSGTINALLRSMGMKTINFMQEPQFFRPIYVIANIWQGVGWGSIVYLSALTNVDQTLYEAAMVDGASRFKQVIHITLPSILGTIVVMFILQIGSLLSVSFDMVYLLQQPTNYSVSEVLATYIYKIGITGANYSVATVAGLFNSVVSLALVLFANLLSRKYAEVSII